MTEPARELHVTRLDPRARLPARAYQGDAGLDLCALDDCRLEPGERATIATGVAVAIPPGHAGLVLPRSGLAARHGIALVNAPGLIDSGYRGELKCLLLNTDRTDAVSISAGDRIAQLVVISVALPAVIEMPELPESRSGRGTGGFGSSGGSAG